MKKLYKLTWDARRQGTLKGLFIAEDYDVEAAMNKEVYFGEVLGKHSEIYGPLEARDITEITDDQDFINKFQEIVGVSFGYNPLNYLKENL